MIEARMRWDPGVEDKLAKLTQDLNRTVLED